MKLDSTKLICFMPSYNKAQTIVKAIESVLMQKADFAYKLVIIDDCSSDDSHAIALEYERKYPHKITLLKNSRNLGQLASMNHNAYPLLKDIDYFCVLDPDDWYIYDKKFADAIAFLEAHKDFSAYSTNVEIVQSNGKSNKFYDGDKQCVDFDFSDFKNGKGIFVQTSGSIFRNLYFKDGIDERYLWAMKQPYARLFSADGFMNPWHLKGGKFRFVNRIESVYNYNDNGEWASLPQCKQYLLNAELNLGFSDFFSDNDKAFFLQQAKWQYDLAVSEFRRNAKDLIMAHKDDIFRIYMQTYLCDNLIFDSPNTPPARVNSWLENIFSVRKSADKRHKIVTIFGLKFKIK